MVIWFLSLVLAYVIAVGMADGTVRSGSNIHSFLFALATGRKVMVDVFHIV